MIKRLVTRYWPLVPLLILVVVLLDRVEQPDVITEDTIDMRETRSDYYMSDFLTRRFGPAGQIEYIVAGKTLAHYPLDDHSQITAPRVELRRENILWTMESNSGRYDPAPNLFTLQGGVTIKRAFQGTEPDNSTLGILESPTITLTTNSLRILTNSNLVETDEMVEITAPTWQVQAKGLRTAIDEGHLSLLSDVVGRYEIPTQPAED